MTYRNDLIKCLQHLAAHADAQIRYLKELGTYFSVDELALEFSELAMLSRQMLQADKLTQSALQSLDTQLGSFSSVENKSLWTAHALASAQEWEAVRSTARDCLRRLGRNET